MLNRKLSDYIYYGTLVLILVVVVLIRFVLLNNINSKIETIDRDNISLQSQIEALNEMVQENKDIQTAHLYELYDIIPNNYSSTSLTYKVVSMLEEIGVDESEDMQRDVYINEAVNLNSSSLFSQMTEDYEVYQVEVFFTAQNGEIINEFIDALYDSEQLFIIHNLGYTIPENEDFITVVINFLAVYSLEETTEVTASE